MGVDEDKKEKIVRLFKEAAKKSDSSKEGNSSSGGDNRVSGQSARGQISIGGNACNSVIVNGNVTLGSFDAMPSQGGDSVKIDDKQAKALHKLKDSIIELEPEPDKAEAAKNVWRTLNRAMEVETMRDLTTDKFAHAKNYLNAWLSRLKREQAQEQVIDLRAEIMADLVTEVLEIKVARYVASHWPGKSVESLDDVNALSRVKRYLAALSNP